MSRCNLDKFDRSSAKRLKQFCRLGRWSVQRLLFLSEAEKAFFWQFTLSCVYKSCSPVQNERSQRKVNLYRFDALARVEQRHRQEPQFSIKYILSELMILRTLWLRVARGTQNFKKLKSLSNILRTVSDCSTFQFICRLCNSYCLEALQTFLE